jgi:(E)-4-hydroxy-3-methylbut-2-enyl-diphosphate synthase
MNYCISLTNYNRNQTIEVQIGSTPIGDKHPIRLQSMTNTDTSDIENTLNQTIEIINKGADYVRITTPNIQDIVALAEIKKRLRSLGYQTPLIADIHFNTKVAFAAAEIVEKIRINPGNFAYSSTSNTDELEIIKKRLIPLLEICKKYKTAVRIGTNHGSLSKRIIEKFGDTPLGMVEATLEFLRICKEVDFRNIVISLKSSNTVIMVQACRLLVQKMNEENLNYPLHLGVTEAGEGEDGRIKSAIGIGALLIDGIGDTIRVSLTEAPEKEIPVSKLITSYSISRKDSEKFEEITSSFFDPFSRLQRQTFNVNNIGANNIPVVISNFSNFRGKNNELYSLINKDFTPDYIYLGDKDNIIELPENVNYIINSDKWKNKKNVFPLFDFENFLESKNRSEKLNFILIDYTNIHLPSFDKINNNSNVVFILHNITDNYISELRLAFSYLNNKKSKNPVIIFKESYEKEITDFQIKTSIDLSVFLIDGLINGIYLSNNSKINNVDIVKTSFAILQVSRLRISKTEYISCPSCGRTLFDLEGAIAKIRKKTNHLKGLKIAIMGCIVNGPGEMSDADYGYVGAGAGRITLYKNKEIIKKNIPETDAVEELILLIKKYGDWIEET